MVHEARVGMKIGRSLMLWLGSFLIVAMILIFYFRAPVLPILAGGAAAWIVTAMRKKKSA